MSNIMEFVKPKDIENESMRRIEEGMRERGIVVTEEQMPVVRRVIHTTADFEYADNMYFSPDAITRAKAALMAGNAIITDTNMALAGVSKPSCAKWGCEPCCFMADPEIAAKAKAEGTTRAYAAITHASELYPNGIFVAGNAPTALIRLDEIIRENTEFRPSLIVGVPVGFVNVVESKEIIKATCEEFDIPCIIAMGQKGGSTVAAAIMNALFYSL